MAKQEKTAAELYREERKARIAKAAKKNAKKSHKVIMTKGTKTAIAIALVIALVAGIGAFAVSNSGILERGKVAFNVGDVEVTVPEYTYYYNAIFNNIFYYSYQYDSYYGDGMGAMYTGYDYSIAPDEQKYTLGEVEGVENPMFTDYFKASAMDGIKYIKGMLAYAAEKGIELDEADLAEVEASIAELEENAKSNNFSLPAYLRKYYGKGMSEDLLRKITQEQTLATKVQTVVTQEYKDSYKSEDIEKEYKDNLKTYGVVSLRLYEVVADTVEVPAEEEGGEATKKVTDATMAQAKTKAESFAARVSTPENFKAAAAEFEKLAGNEAYEEMSKDETKTLIGETTYENLSYDVSDEKFLNWAFDEDTAAGETYIVENKDSGYSVYMMEAPVHKIADSKTYDVRHILIQFPEEEEGEEAEAEEKTEEVEVELLNAKDYDVTVDIDVDLDKTGDKALYKQAQDILETYLAGDKTEEAFAALAVEHSSDGNAAEGGIYEDVTEGKMVAEFENWALEKGRKKGDVGIVETEYGYHIMYFIAVETSTWADAIKETKSAAEFDTFAAEIEDGDNVSVNGIIDEAVAEVDEFIVKLAKEQIRSIKANAAAGASAY